ncbi:hypothetical protein HPB52_023853 [Rhipicephalus sanguineus]|uniref:Uncharacterized protein n=1 Tax=Rhipicephalus sanguineus TaxID=34632 RepID=A0A9D4PT41_RHISA|nr:hypothetical protein HPB52_023853 [Rhipicephalus sanguineus]
MDWVQERARGSPTKPSSPVVPTGDAPPLSLRCYVEGNLSAAIGPFRAPTASVAETLTVERQQWPPGWSPAGRQLVLQVGEALAGTLHLRMTFSDDVLPYSWQQLL